MELAMTIVHPATFAAHAASHLRRFAARAGRSLGAAILARATRRALNELPDDLLRDVGLTRSDIPFVADAVGCGSRNPSCDARDWLCGSGKPASFVMKLVAPEAATTASPAPK